MPIRPLTLCALLRKAFLRGVPLNVAEFADSRHFERASVYRALRQFGDLVYADTEHNWHCRDLAKMREFDTPERAIRRAKRADSDRRRREVKAPAGPWGDLLAAWGLPLVPIDIDLPRRPHTLATAEDNRPDPVGWMEMEHHEQPSHA